jgi:putative oxidoreductase
MKKLLDPHPLHTSLGILLLRLIFGGLFVYYGYGKVMAYDNYSANFPDIIGIGAKLSFNLVIFAELICGALVLIGLFTRLAVIPIFITMVVAYFIAHEKDTFDVKQLAFVHMLLSIVIFILGSGRFSVDHIIFNNRTTRNDPNRHIEGSRRSPRPASDTHSSSIVS